MGQNQLREVVDGVRAGNRVHLRILHGTQSAVSVRAGNQCPDQEDKDFSLDCMGSAGLEPPAQRNELPSGWQGLRVRGVLPLAFHGMDPKALLGLLSATSDFLPLCISSLPVQAPHVAAGPGFRGNYPAVPGL